MLDLMKATIQIRSSHPPGLQLTPPQQSELDTSGHWNGGVWRAWAWLRATRPDLVMAVVDVDEGCGVIRRGSQVLAGVNQA